MHSNSRDLRLWREAFTMQDAMGDTDSRCPRRPLQAKVKGGQAIFRPPNRRKLTSQPKSRSEAAAGSPCFSRPCDRRSRPRYCHCHCCCFCWCWARARLPSPPLRPTSAPCATCTLRREGQPGGQAKQGGRHARHGGCGRDMEMSENIQMRERSRDRACTHRTVIFVIFTMETGIVPLS